MTRCSCSSAVWQYIHGRRPLDLTKLAVMMPGFLTALKRHPFGIEAFFDYSLVLTYALPADFLQSLLPPRLEVDRSGDLGFIAIALVKTRQLRPTGFPKWLGRSFFLSGYRIFTRFPVEGRRYRGLKILRSDTDSWSMVFLGNLMTHYSYHKVELTEHRADGQLGLEVASRDGLTDLSIKAQLRERELPSNSPFEDWREARKWCGPLPFTFSPEASSGKMIVVEGVRSDWAPIPIKVSVERINFFKQENFKGVKPVLANAFYTEGIPYRWKPGVLK